MFNIDVFFLLKAKCCVKSHSCGTGTSRICQQAQVTGTHTYIFFSLRVGHRAIQSTKSEVSQIAVIHQNVKHHSHLREQQDLQNQQDSLLLFFGRKETTMAPLPKSLALPYVLAFSVLEAFGPRVETCLNSLLDLHQPWNGAEGIIY